MSTTYPDTQLWPVDIVDAIRYALAYKPFPGSPIASGVEDAIADQRHAEDDRPLCACGNRALQRGGGLCSRCYDRKHAATRPPAAPCRCGCGRAEAPKRRGLSGRCYRAAKRDGTLDELYPPKPTRTKGDRA